VLWRAFEWIWASFVALVEGIAGWIWAILTFLWFALNWLFWLGSVALSWLSWLFGLGHVAVSWVFSLVGAALSALLNVILSLPLLGQIAVAVLFLAFLTFLTAITPFGMSYFAWLLSKLPGIPIFWAKGLKQTSDRLQVFANNLLTTLISPIVRFDIPTKGDVLYYAGLAEAAVSAVLRQEFLSSVPDRGPVYEPKIEVPPGYESVDIETPERSLSAAVANGVRLRCEQSSGDAGLLFGRGCDAIRFVFKRLELDEASISVSLRPLRGWERKSDRYPWILSVGYAGNRLPVRKELEGLRFWLGIGVEFSRPIKPTIFRKCGSSAKCEIEREGSIAGVLRDSANTTKEYAITCDHVIPKTCKYAITYDHVIPETAKSSALTPAKKTAVTEAPDAVLLPATCQCFATPRLRTNLSSLTTGEIIAATEWRISGIRPSDKHLIYKIGGRSGRTTGLVKYALVEFPFKSERSRFPACCAELYRLKFFWGLVRIPFFRKSFSVPGDSGSWVITKNGSGGNHWLGMVQGGDGRDTIILHAPSLIAYFSELLRASLEPIISQEM
jgi:hypothetical protein